MKTVVTAPVSGSGPVHGRSCRGLSPQTLITLTQECHGRELLRCLVRTIASPFVSYCVSSRDPFYSEPQYPAYKTATIKSEISAQRGSFGDGYPADIRRSFARTSRPKTSVRALEMLEKQAFGRGHPTTLRDFQKLRIGKTHNTLLEFSAPVNKIWPRTDSTTESWGGFHMQELL